MNKKIIPIEGLRGIACLIVLYGHFMAAFFPRIISFNLHESHIPAVEKIFQNFPFAWIGTGELGVCIFLIITGYLTGKKFLRQQPLRHTFTFPIKRYLRLAPIIILGNMYSFLCMSLGWTFNHQVGLVTHSTWWLSQAWTFPATIQGAAFQTFILVFISNIPFVLAYNPVLWPIPIFFLGSVGIATLATFTRRINSKTIHLFIYAGILIALIRTFAFPLLIGLLYADFEEIFSTRSRYGNFLLLFFFIYLGSYPTTTTPNSLTNITEFLPSNTFITPHMSFLYHTLAALCIFQLSFSSAHVQSLLTNTIITTIGSISYPIFVFSVPLLFSLSSVIFLTIHSHVNYGAAAILSSGISFSILISTILLIKFIQNTQNKLAKPKLGFF